MEENTPWSGIIVFLCLLILNYILHGFGGALGALSNSKIEEAALQGDSKARKLWCMIEQPSQLKNTIHLLTTLSSIVIGSYVLEMYSNLFRGVLHQVGSLSVQVETAVSWLVIGVFDGRVALVFAFSLRALYVLSTMLKMESAVSSAPKSMP